MGFLIPVVAALIGIIGVIMLMISDAKPTRWKFLAGGLIVLLWFILAGLTYLHNEADATETQGLKDRIDEHVEREAKHATELAEHIKREAKLKGDYAEQARLTDTVVDLVGILRDMLAKSDVKGLTSVKNNATTVLQKVNTPKARSIAKKFEASRVIKTRDHRSKQ